MQLNHEQQIAVDARRGRILVVAAPGSGKTRVIVQRVLDILRQGTPARRILSTTFTREAANEMSNRAARYLSGMRDDKIPQAHLDKVKKHYGLEVPYGHHIFCTFHSLALRFIKANQREHFSHLAAHVLASGTETGRALRTAMSSVGMKPKQKRDLISYISKCKRMRIGPEAALEDAENSGGDFSEQYAEAYEIYENTLHEMGVLDFDSLLVEMANLLEKNTEVRMRWQFKYVQVDEAQDTDVLQWAILDKLTEMEGNLFCVGDENQGMYSFRGAESDLQAKFAERYPGATVLILPENYRSTEAIVNYCKEIAPLQNETVLNLRTSQGKGVPNEFVFYATEEEEASWVLKKIVDIPRTAILARTNAQLQPFEDGCTDRGIPFHILGKGGFWRQHEVETCMAFVRCMLAPTEKSLMKVIRSPYDIARAKRDDKDAVVTWLLAQKKVVHENKLLDSLRRYNHPTFRNLPAFFDTARLARGRCGEIVQGLFQRAGAVGYYKEKEGEEADLPDNSRLENISRLITIADRFSDLNRFLLFAERVRRENKAAKDALTLSTIHKAKGLEWQDVFVVGVNEGKLPSSYAVTEHGLNEEKRIYFVACSRAARRLHVSCSGIPSEFIAHLITAPPVVPKIPETGLDILHRFGVSLESGELV